MNTGDLELGYDLFKLHCNPSLALRAELTGQPHRYHRVEGGELVDRDAGVLEDWITGWGTQVFGHRHPHVVKRLQDYLASDAPTFYSSGVSAPAGLLAGALCERTGYERAWFASGGTEAVEAALKLARAATGRTRVLYFEGGYHGCTFGSVSMMNAGEFRDAFGPGVAGFEALPFGDVEALAAALAPGDVAAVVVEPIQIEGGVREASDEFQTALCALTREFGALLVADEIQTGLGRTGRFLWSSTWNRRPDIVCLGKALSGGLVPISAILTTAETFDAAYGDFHTAESHNSTFSGNGLAAVAALATLELLTDEAAAHAQERSVQLEGVLAGAADAFPGLVADVRGRGLIWGVELGVVEHPYLTFEYLGLSEFEDRPAAALVLAHRLYRQGYITAVCGHDWRTLRLQPRLDISEAAVDRFGATVREELTWLQELA